MRNQNEQNSPTAMEGIKHKKDIKIGERRENEGSLKRKQRTQE